MAYGLDERAAKFVLKGYFPHSGVAADITRNLSPTPFGAMIDAIKTAILGMHTQPHFYGIVLLEYATLFAFIVAGLAPVQLPEPGQRENDRQDQDRLVGEHGVGDERRGQREAPVPVGEQAAEQARVRQRL